MARISPLARKRLFRRDNRGGGTRIPQDPRFGPPPMPVKGRGYQGLDDIVEFLSGGISEQQFNRMGQGYTGRNGAIGGAKGLFSGLSPYAVHFLTTSGLLEREQPELAETEGLEGDALFQANLMNTLRQQQPGRYKLRSGIDDDFLSQVFAMNPMGQSAYARGFNAEGPALGAGGPFKPPAPGPRNKFLKPKLINRGRKPRGGFHTGPDYPGGPYW